MKTRLLPLVALFLLIFSCKDVEEPSPNSRIEGTYEFTSEGNMGWGEDSFRFVNRIQFNSDGTVTGEDYTTEVDSDDILGYRGYFTGTYTIVDGEVTISYDKLYYMNLMDANYIPKEDLVLSEGTDFIPEYEIAEDYSKLLLLCSPYSNCTVVSYLRVD